MSPAAAQRLAASHREFLAFLERRVESRASAEDILQGAFARTLEQSREVDEANVVAWFYRVLRNALTDHYRRRAAAGRALAAFQREFGDAHQPPPELRQEICACLARLLQTLKPEYRDALRIVDMDEGSLADLARHASISPQNAAVRVHRARKALRAKLVVACGVCCEHGCRDCSCAA